ncbi:MAG: hypothetical protein PHF60_00310 [Candidatus ainarchaeum sp.]|nr:hypothetical protein [Candidatus ainarchaeum sp.]
MRLPIIALFMLALILTAYAEDFVAINSNDGRDVLSGIFYANAMGLPVKFMPLPGGNADVFAAKVGSNHDILLIQGSTPISSFVESNLKNKNNTVTVYTSTDASATNLDLAKRSGATSFIIVDSSYSDSALSVLPYAALTKSYVILANSNNIASVKETVKDADKIIIFGLVDQEVKDELAEFNPEILGKGEDKYEDNIIMVKKTMDEFSLKSPLVVDGTFIEEGMAEGKQPILLTGRLVPQGTYDFIKQYVRDGKLTGVMLVGNDLVVPIYDMRERMVNEFKAEGLNKTFGITVKFAQVVPSAGTSVLVLDTFSMPAYQPSLEVTEIIYNKDNNKVMVSVGNIGEGSAYYAVEVRIKVNGQDYKLLGSNETKLIERGEQAGSEYPLDLSGVSEGSVTATVIVKYGSSKKSLEEYTTKEGPLTSVSYTDTSNVTVKYVKYDADKKSVLVTLQNLGNGPAYLFTKLSLNIGGVPTNISSSGTKTLERGSMMVEEFPLEISQADLDANKEVTVYVDYGGREGFLMKKAAYIVPLETQFPLLLLLGGIVLLVLLAVAAYYMLGRKGKEKKR